METEEEVDILMSSDIYSATLSTKSITFSRAQSGWLFREDKTVSPSSVFEFNLIIRGLRISFNPGCVCRSGSGISWQISTWSTAWFWSRGNGEST